jgi:hypothetical protein
MANRVISKTTNIYVYPSEQESHLGSVTLGDLHGNAVKLLHFLFQYQIIGFKNEVSSPEKTYEEFVTLYESYGDILEEYLGNSTLLQLERFKIINAKERIENIKNQLLENKDSTQYQSLFLLQQQIESRLETSLECKKRLKQLRKEIITKIPPILEEFNQFINKIKIKDRAVLVRLIGDELADRGHCDYFTLRIMDFFVQDHGRLAIIFSNHGYEFISAYEKLAKNLPFVPQQDIADFQTTSLYGLKLLLEHEFIAQNELVNLTCRSYKQSLKLIDYSLDESGITLFSHAPIRFDHLELTARFLKVTYDDSTKEELAKTIDEINRQLAYYIHDDISHLLFHSDCINDKTRMTEEERAMWPLVYLIWNRWDQTKETKTARPANKNGYLITYVHGHDSFQSALPHVQNLDTLCGKDSRKKEEAQINQSFQFLTENKYTSIDRTAVEDYLRTVQRSKVFDSNGYGLQSDKQDEILPVESPLDALVTMSLNRLSLFGKASQVPNKQQEETANPFEAIL